MKQKKKSVKYLGVVLEQCLSGAYMVTSVIQKANVRLKFFIQNADVFTFDTKKLLVMSLIQCHIDYECSFWYPGLSKVLKTIIRSSKNSYGLFLTWIQEHM